MHTEYSLSRVTVLKNSSEFKKKKQSAVKPAHIWGGEYWYIPQLHAPLPIFAGSRTIELILWDSSMTNISIIDIDFIKRIQFYKARKKKKCSIRNGCFFGLFAICKSKKKSKEWFRKTRPISKNIDNVMNIIETRRIFLNAFNNVNKFLLLLTVEGHYYHNHHYH